jgi:hypothetical protein
VICHANIGIPIWIYVVGGGGQCNSLLFENVGLIKYVPTLSCTVVLLEADLAEDSGVVVVPLGVVVAVVNAATPLTSSAMSRMGTTTSCVAASRASSASESSSSNKIDRLILPILEQANMSFKT